MRIKARQNNFRSVMKYFFVVLLALIVIVLFGCIFFYQGIYLPKEPNSTERVTFLVKKGEGAKEISINLKERGLIKHSSLFRIYALIQGKAGELKAGEYELSPAMTIPEVVDKLASGEMVKKTITIIEGWNLRDIGGYLEEKGIAKAEELFELDKQKNLEGYLFPDTYEISPEDEIEEIAEKMLANFEKKVTPELREEIISQGKSIFEIITMASLLEKEVKTFEDKKIVSGVLWKRLENKMLLQVDATIIYIRQKGEYKVLPSEARHGSYITGGKTTKISKQELQIDSPYNTYKYPGLPQGPVCNPGLESIKAAIYPETSTYWFYLSTPDGKTIFSKTLEEHNIAKAKYLK